MDGKQLLAKIGVFLLLGVNVAAYYFLWPRHDSGPKTQPNASVEPKGQTHLLPEKKAPKIDATELPGDVYGIPAPLYITKPPAPTTAKTDDGDALGRLLDHIKKEADVPKALTPIGPLTGDRQASGPEVVAIPVFLAPKINASEWLLTMKKSGPQTRLTAKLVRAERSIDVEILCDRLDATGPNGVYAAGHVTFSSPGMKGACQSLTVPWDVPKVIFTGRVAIARGSDSTSWSSSDRTAGDKVIWEPLTNTFHAIAPDVRPADVLLPVPPPRGILGSPK